MQLYYHVRILEAPTHIYDPKRVGYAARYNEQRLTISIILMKYRYVGVGEINGANPNKQRCQPRLSTLLSICME